jgi:hypothetical protein
MVIGVNLRRFPLRIFEVCRGQWSKSSALKLLEQFAPGFAVMAHGAVVDIFQKLANGGIQVLQ